jgi:hypothetical protein
MDGITSVNIPIIYSITIFIKINTGFTLFGNSLVNKNDIEEPD